MEGNTETIIKTLIAVAWADGRVEDQEKAIIDTLIDAYQVTGEDAERIRAWAAERKSLDQVEFGDLGDADRILLLQQAVFVTFVDGDQSPKELELLQDLSRRMGLEEARGRALIRVATDRARLLYAETAAS